MQQKLTLTAAEAKDFVSEKLNWLASATYVPHPPHPLVISTTKQTLGSTLLEMAEILPRPEFILEGWSPANSADCWEINDTETIDHLIKALLEMHAAE